MTTTQQYYQQLLEPSEALIGDLKKIEGDIIILGAGGKMGPDLARLAKKTSDLAGSSRRIIAVSRFTDAEAKESLEAHGVETISADLLNEEQLKALPDAPNVIYMAGTKFGTTGNEYFTWAMNTYLSGRVAEKFKSSRIVVFSTGNVYPLVPVFSGGATEKLPVAPLGEYAQSCLGRERLFEYQASLHKTPLLIFRLNYANDVGYGVLLEIARSVLAEKEIDLRMGHVNSIWQGDANEIAIRSLLHCSNPAKLLNVTGPETISVREAADHFGLLLNKTPKFINEEQSTALLSNASECMRLFGYPRITLLEMMGIQAQWLLEGGKLKNKPTHFQARDGKY